MSFNTVFNPANQSFYNFISHLETYQRLGMPFRFYYKKGLTERVYYIHELHDNRFVGYSYSNDGRQIWGTFKYDFIDAISQPIQCLGCMTDQKHEEMHMGSGGCLNIGDLQVN
jgi:hypothetical protein